MTLTCPLGLKEVGYYHYRYEASPCEVLHWSKHGTRQGDDVQ